MNNIRSSSPEDVYNSIQREQSPVDDASNAENPLTSFLLGREIKTSIASPEKNSASEQEKMMQKKGIEEKFSSSDFSKTGNSGRKSPVSIIKSAVTRMFAHDSISQKEYEQAADALGRLISAAKKELRPMYREFNQHFSGDQLERAVKEKVFGFLHEEGPSLNDPVLRHFFTENDSSAFKPLIDFIHGEMKFQNEPAQDSVKNLLDKMLDRSPTPSPRTSEEDVVF